MTPSDTPTTPEPTPDEIRLAREWLRASFPGASDATAMSLASLLASYRAQIRRPHTAS